MTLSCQSCGIPLTNDFKTDASNDFCVNCCDSHGKLLSREIIQQGIASWLQGFAPDEKGINFLQRADYYLKSMPAWADK